MVRGPLALAEVALDPARLKTLGQRGGERGKASSRGPSFFGSGRPDKRCGQSVTLQRSPTFALVDHRGLRVAVETVALGAETTGGW